MSADAASDFPVRPLPALAHDAHKGTAGRLLCWCGSEAMPGAAILVLRAAARAGVGRITLGVTAPSLFQVVPPAVPEAVLWRPRSEDEPWPAGMHARVAGPGLGTGAETRRLVERLIDEAEDGTFRGPTVLDADALNVLAGEPERIARAEAPVILTPHGGEARALLGRPVPQDPDGRAAFARELAERSGALVCLKGPGTVVTDGRRLRVNPTGNPGLATAGSGDVLCGILGAFLAASFAAGRDDALEVCALAVLAHGLAGDLAAGHLGRRALIASDLVEGLPDVHALLEDPEEARALGLAVE